jgi:hypothetical protein
MDYNIKPYHERYNSLGQRDTAKALKSRDRYLVMIPYTGKWADLEKKEYKEYVSQLGLRDPHNK